MYTVGSLFYAIYFFVSFPVFFRLDEARGTARASTLQCVCQSLASAMVVTLLLDFWRLGLGPISSSPSTSSSVSGISWL